jgi:dipeptidyl aminopeptidase/acylaminoacyl peptidase
MLALGLLASQAIPARTPDLEQIMADPAWMGPPVEQAWWSLDGSAVFYRLQRAETEIDDLRRIDLAAGEDRRLAYEDHDGISGPSPVFSTDGRRALFIREGNLFLDSRDGTPPRQLTQGGEPVQQSMFGSEPDTVLYRRGLQWWLHSLTKGLARPVADLRFEDDPDHPPDDALAQMQLRLFSSLQEDADRARAQRAEAVRASRLDASRGAAPWYLGKAFEAVRSSLSPDGRWLLLAVRPTDHEDGRAGRMPHYVTVNGYIDVEDVRTRVGRNPPARHSLWLLDLVERRKHELDLSALPGIQEDPLAELKEAQGISPLPEGENRAVSILDITWQPRGSKAAVMIRANDNKDRWIASLDPGSAQLKPRHRLHDPAWINRRFNEFGWLGTSDQIWFLSEESGFSHFYTVHYDQGAPEARTAGEFEVTDVSAGVDGRQAWLLSNRSHPTEYDLYRLDLDSGALVRLTEQRAVEDFALLPHHDRILVRFSGPYLPPQVGLIPIEGGPIRTLTDTRSDIYRSIDWQRPQIVGVPSNHGAGTIWSKFYPAQTEALEKGHPVVLFVHGAGYLQNVMQRYPPYFREQMFHNLLAARGYHVLDMDFRASSGYGRDWRTSIYRQMGTPELEDLIDGVRWLVEKQGADPERVGLYGGSYGGFMTFMALFKAPAVFRSGAALRPVSDWAHYAHSYTSNILNTPEVDPQAYARSSPIEFAEHFRGHLLMTHGMLDDNVFYQDVVRLTQRLIDLEKQHWELASYPLEGHGFRRPSSWLDQYRRILSLFERTIGEVQ